MRIANPNAFRIIQVKQAGKIGREKNAIRGAVAAKPQPSLLNEIRSYYSQRLFQKQPEFSVKYSRF